jgi:serine/threonine-protein kinase
MDPFVSVSKIDIEIEEYLNDNAHIFKKFGLQDSGCVSWGTENQWGKKFVKFSEKQKSIERLQRVRLLYNEINHAILPDLLNSIVTPSGFALVYEWVVGENLYDYTSYTSNEMKRNPQSPYSRLKQSPIIDILKLLNIVYDFHVDVEEANYVEVDFYDGCLIYDFETKNIKLVDLDEYHKGPFILDRDRLPGSLRFMAPEEFTRGAVIDNITNVFTLGKLALEYLSDGTIENWKGSEAMLKIIKKATSQNRDIRYKSIKQFYKKWTKAQGTL